MRLGKAGWWIIPPCLPWLLSEDGAWGHSQIMQWSHPKSCMLKVLSAQQSLLKEGTQGQLSALVTAKLPAGKTPGRSPQQASPAEQGLPGKSQSQQCPQTPHSSCLSQSSPREFSPMQSQLSAQNQTGSNSCSGEAFNEKLNSIILKVFSNLNVFFD